MNRLNKKFTAFSHPKVKFNNTETTIGSTIKKIHSLKLSLTKLGWTTLLAMFAICTSNLASAGAEAKVHVCVLLTVKPSNPLTFKFKKTASHCMLKKGNNIDLKANKAGLSCQSIGNVETKSSSTQGDTCATDDSYWGIGYTVDNAPYSGSTSSIWSANTIFERNSIKLKDASPNTHVCTGESLCPATEQLWWDIGNLYFIFQPFAK